MELNQQASFIPKKPIVSQPEVGYGEGGFSVVTFISVILFVLSLSLAAGVTLYQSVKIKQLADKEASYKKAINDPNQAPNINKWREMDERLQQASQLLENHISMNAFLAKLEFQTVKNVQFTSIDVNPADQSGADNSILPKTFKGQDKIEPAEVSNKKVQYLYNDGEDFHFMDPETFEQFQLFSHPKFH
jgi:hypothetical protein